MLFFLFFSPALCFSASVGDFLVISHCVFCRLKPLHQHQWSMRLPTCPPWEAVSHFCCFILLLLLLGQREQGEVCFCCRFYPPNNTNPPPTRSQPNHQTTKLPTNQTTNNKMSTKSNNQGCNWPSFYYWLINWILWKLWPVLYEILQSSIWYFPFACLVSPTV